MGGSVKKSTRKFEKNHLKDTLERRKDFKKIKQKKVLKEKKKAKMAREAGKNGVTDEDEEDGEELDTETRKQLKGGKENNAFSKMSVDEFFQGGFEIPQATPSSSKNKKTKELKPKTGKRKRGELMDEDIALDSDGNIDLEALPSDSELGSDGADDENFGGDLKALAEKDPGFFKYLQQNDSELLEFDEQGDLAELEELSEGVDNDEEDEENEQQEPKPKKRKSEKKGVIQEDEGEDMEIGAFSGEESEAEDGDDAEIVTMALLKKWRAALTEEKSLRATRQVMLAFRAAAYVNDDEGKNFKYSVSNPDVYHELLLLTLKEMPNILNHHLPVKESSSGKVRVPTDTKKYRNLSPLLKSYSSSLLHLLAALSDAATIKLTLTSLQPLLPYLISFRKLLRNLVKVIVGIWSDPSSTEATRITAFLALRRLAVIGDATLREAVLKTVYQGLVAGSRNTNANTIQGINLMKNSAAELWGIDGNVGYSTGFTSIRQLAIHLRGSITNNSKDTYKTIYNTQYIHSLDFWSRVLSTHCPPPPTPSSSPSPLQPLIYPTTQITLGALRLIPSPQYFPLRFQLLRSLLRLSAATNTYIPLASSLLEVLNSAEMKRVPKPSMLKTLDFETAIRAPKAYLGTRVYQDGVGEVAVELLGEFFGGWTKSIAFPELALPVIVMLKRWLKEVSSSTSSSHSSASTAQKSKGNKNAKVNNMVQVLIQKLEANSRFIEEKRRNVHFAPSERDEVEQFLKDVDWEVTPVGAYVAGQRKGREERKKMVEKGRQEEEARRKRDEGKGGSGDEDESDDE